MSTDTDPSGSPQQAFLQSPQLHRLLRGLIVFLSGFFLLLFLYTALRRMRYPFELEEIESGILISVRRIVLGKGLYVAPSLDFVPFLYAPLYFYIAAAATKLVGVSYTALRLVSTVSTLGSCLVIYAFVSTETRRRLAAIAGVGLFLACYPWVEAFYDIGRTDSLCTFFMLAALFFSRRGRPVLAALAWVLCTQTKQTLLPIAFLMLCADWQHWRRVLTGLGVFMAATGAVILGMNHATGGWYSFYLFHIAGRFPVTWRMAFLYFPDYILAPTGIALLLCLAAWAFTGVDLRTRVASFYAIVTALLVASICYVSVRAGVVNVGIPLYAWMAVLFGVVFDRLLARLERSRQPRAALASTVLLAAVVVQLSMFLYNPGRYLPSPAVRQARQRFIDQIHDLPGDVYVVRHNYDALLAGKQAHAEHESLGTVLFMPTGAIAADLRAQFDESLRSHRYSAIVIDGPLSVDSYHFQDAYPYALSAEGEEGRFLTTQPSWILLPCATAAALTPIVMREDTSIRPEKCSLAQP